MKQELDKKLVKDFPNLYKDRNGDMLSTCLCWGFEHGDGWYNIIRELSEKLEPLIIKYRKENPDDEYYPRASQVKEKFGGLRFYMSSATMEMWELIEKAEDKSYTTCEVCGEKGKVRGGGWLKCLCTEHAIEKGYLPKEFWKRQLAHVKNTYRSYKRRLMYYYYETMYRIRKLFRSK